MPSEPPIRVGRAEVVPLLDGWAALPLEDEAPGHDVDWTSEARRFPWLVSDDGHDWRWHVRAFLVRTGGVELLVDTGIGHLGRPPYSVGGEIDASLEQAGTAASAIAHVVLTHLHADHAGGACTPDGDARFPNATYHVHDADWRYFAEGDEDFGGRAAMARLETDGRLAISSIDHTVVPGVRVVHTPGHTPGHRSVLLDGGDEMLLFTGDLLHTPVQIAHPGWPSAHDVDPQLGAASRRIQLFRARASGWRVAVTHFGRPFGRVTGDGWVPDPGVSAAAPNPRAADAVAAPDAGLG